MPPPAAATEPPRRAALRTGSVEEAHWRTQQLMTRHRMTVSVDGEPFEARVDTDQCDGLGVMHFSFGAEVHIDSEALEDFVTIHLPLTGRLHVEHQGARTVAHPRQAAVFSAHGPMTLQWERGLRLLVVKIDRLDLERRLRELVGRPLRDPLVFDVAAPLDGASRTLDGVTDLIGRAFAAAGPAGPAPVVRAELKNAVLTGLLLGHRHSASDAVFAPRQPPQPRALRRALELIEDGPPLAADELARRVGVSERSLYETFHRRFGLSPVAYSRRIRLERVRDDLQRLSPGAGVTVADVAMRHGFHHPSRFAATYRSRFGELPSATLRQAH